MVLPMSKGPTIMASPEAQPQPSLNPSTSALALPTSTSTSTSTLQPPFIHQNLTPTTTESELPLTPSTSSSAKPVLQPVYRSMLDIGADTSTRSATTQKKPRRVPTTGIVPVDPNDLLPPTPPPKDAPKLPRHATSPELKSKCPARQSARPTLNRNSSDKQLKEHITNGTEMASTPSRPPLKSAKTAPKEGLLKRVGSFLNKKKGQSPPPEPRVVKPVAQNSVPQNTAVPVFTFSTTPPTSASVTPSSPGSRESTIIEQDEILVVEDLPLQDMNALGHAHTNVPGDRASMTAPRTAVTWGPNYNEDGTKMEEPPKARRRSISQDHLNILRRPNQPQRDDAVEMMATFSFRSVEGAGLKARRLSTCLPDEFHVDFCELDNEFKSSSHVPGRRGQTIGKGATATVKLMFKKGDNSHTYFAVKEFRKKDKTEDDLEYVKKVKSEYSIARSLHHPNIVQTVRLCTHNQRWNHVMEYCQFGEMYHWVEKGLFRTFFKPSDRLCFFKQLIRGVDYLHSHGIAHRDIKLENLLLNSQGYLKITDFGVSEVFSGEHPGLRETGGECGKNMGDIRRCAPGICGSLPYIAPEVLDKSSEYDPRPLDVWSCAIAYLTMTLQASPWASARTTDPFYAKYKAAWDTWMQKHPDGIISDGAGGAPTCGPLFTPETLGSPPIKRLILKMLNPDPEKRISIHDALLSRAVKNIECCAPEYCLEDGTPVEQTGTGDCCGKKFARTVMRKHSHIPPKDHKTPIFFQHRFDLGDGYR